MQSYPTIDACNLDSTVFDRAEIEPVLIAQQSRPSHVLMSVKTYQQLIDRLAELDDMLLGQAASTALSNSQQMVGVEKFTSILKHLANGKA